MKDLFESISEWYTNVKAGADPIEALHGHLCGPHCFHWMSTTKERRALLLKAPWNKEADPKSIDDETSEEFVNRWKEDTK